MKKIILCISWLLLLMGCTARGGQQPTLTGAAFTQTSRPTQTIAPLLTFTQTAAPSKTATQTAAPTFTSIPSPTPNLVATVIAAEPSRLYASYPSPDGMWRVDILIYDCIQTSKTEEGGWNENAYEQVRLVNLANGDEQVADEQLQFCGGLGAFGFDGRFWSPDSRYFYYTTARQGVPDGCGYWEPPLYRIDTHALTTPQYVGMGTRSPDGKQLATWNWPENSLTIWNIADGEIHHFPALEESAEIGPIAWSADSQTLVYLQVDSWCPLSGKSYLVWVDITNDKQTPLLESSSPTFGSIKWDKQNVLSLFDENGQEWHFDLQTRELTQNP
ncbi:MAG TPA: hypothetical protein VLD65_03575 [Anaerolineales bacterium]|nr:hypothetical protein [Anaerolineales bacterium]